MSKSLTFLILVATALSGCAGAMTKRPQFLQADLEAERAYQKQYATEVRVKSKSKYQERVWRVGAKIIEAGAELCGLMGAGAETCDYDIQIEDSSQLNAFSDGRRMVFYTGMLDFLKNDSELALIIGHEFAHNLMAHLDSRRENQTIGAIFGALLDVLTQQRQPVFTKIGAGIGSSANSHDFEFEADYIGLYVTARAGYKFENAPELWRRMSIEHPQQIYFASTHPANAERFVALKQAIAEIKRKKAAKQKLLPEMKGEE